MTNVLSEPDVETWHRDGFLVLEDFVDAHDLDVLRTAYDELPER